MLHCNKRCLNITFTDNEDNIMANDTMKLYKDIADKSIASIKNVSELNLRTFEAIATKQVEIVQNAEISKKLSAIFTDANDINGIFSAQSDLADSYTEELSNSVTDITDILKGAQEELTGLAKEAFEDAKANAEKVVANAKK
jgi:hypothetical protein